MLVGKCNWTLKHKLLCFKNEAQLQTFSDQPSLLLITDIWQ